MIGMTYIYAKKHHLSTGEVATFLGVHQVTIRRWVKEGKLHPIRTPKGSFRFKVDEIFKLACEGNGKFVGYIRVSSDLRKDDLERQKELILGKYPNIQIVQDIESGVNGKRRGFEKLVEMVINREIGKVVVIWRSVLTSFEFENFEKFFNSYGVEIEILNEREETL